MATESVDDLIEELWSIVKKDSLASSRIGSPADYTRDALKQRLEAYYTRECARKVLEGRYDELRSFIAGGRNIYESSSYQIDGPDLAKRLAELRAAIQEMEEKP